MAKGQRRSNREVRKPKQEKVERKTEAVLGSQVKNARQPVEAGTKAKLNR